MKFKMSNWQLTFQQIFSPYIFRTNVVDLFQDQTSMYIICYGMMMKLEQRIDSLHKFYHKIEYKISDRLSHYHGTNCPEKMKLKAKTNRRKQNKIDLKL